MKKIHVMAAAGVTLLMIALFFFSINRADPLARFDNIAKGMSSNEVLRILGPPTEVRDYRGLPLYWQYSYAMGLNKGGISFTTNGSVEGVFVASRVSRKFEMR